MGLFCGYFKDPCFENNDGWFFWDKDWITALGTFPSEELARKELAVYLKKVSRGEVYGYFFG